jgi:hypothetical protein
MNNIQILRHLCRQDQLSKETIESTIKSKTGESVTVNKKNLELDGFEFSLRNERFFVPERKIQYDKNEQAPALSLQKRMLEFSIPLFYHLGYGELDQAILDISKSTNPKESSDAWLEEIFTPVVAATYYNKYFCKSSCLQNYKEIILEALEAYCLSMPSVAIISLLPVFEAGLRNLQHELLEMSLGNVKSELFCKGINNILAQTGSNILSEYNHYPGKDYNSDVLQQFLTYIHPQCACIAAFKLFFQEILYKQSNDETEGFNRHIIVHLLKNDFSSKSNFIRLFLAITNITDIERLHNQEIPFLYPTHDPVDDKLGLYLRMLDKKVGAHRAQIHSDLF